VLKLEDLQPGMELLGSVLNVVDFGAFVDIGLHDSGLVHISHLSNDYVRDPHDVVSVGQVVRVWVLEIDKGRRRVALTMIKPGTGRQNGGQRQGNGQDVGQEQGRSQGRGRDQSRSEGRRFRPPRVPAAGVPTANGGGATQAEPRADRPQGGGRPQGGRRPQGGGRGRPPQREQGPRVYVATAEKVAKPLTKKMKEGKEPLRTFGDLKQFFTTREDSPTTEPETGGEATG
jgi:uncharacterized protein